MQERRQQAERKGGNEEKSAHLLAKGLWRGERAQILASANVILKSEIGKSAHLSAKGLWQVKRGLEFEFACPQACPVQA
eukprot:3388757-Rhodomonas_salina.1